MLFYWFLPVAHFLNGSGRVINILPSGTGGKQLIVQTVQNCLLVYVIQLLSNSIECRGNRFALPEKPQVKLARLAHYMYSNTPEESILIVLCTRLKFDP